MKGLEERFKALYAQACPKCNWTKCRCAEIEAETAAQQAKQAEEDRCHKEAEKAQLITNLGGLRAYEDFTADKFSNKYALEQLKGFPNENYYLWGPAGTGKTHCATAIIRSYESAKVVRAADISRALRACKDADKEKQIIEQYSTGIYLFDDLGVEKRTDFLENVLFEIFNKRWQAKEGGLIITSNMNLVALKAVVGDRTASRIAGLVGSNNTLEFDGKDFRF